MSLGTRGQVIIGVSSSSGAVSARARSRERDGRDCNRAKSKTKYRESITDTDLHGEASHPWVLVRDGGRRVLKLIHKSLEAREKARVKVILKGNSERVVERVTIRVADCTQDPPLYPLSCEIRP